VYTPGEWAQALDDALPWERPGLIAAWMEFTRAGVSALGERNGLPPLTFGEELPDEVFDDPWAV
jgi:hypothetical protein